MPRNLYVHFPFCRRKCTYCALYSRAGVSVAERERYVTELCTTLSENLGDKGKCFSTVYFGGGTPALCDLQPVLSALAPHLTDDCEFSVELHPLDVTDELLPRLRDGGVNRISLGMESLDDVTLVKMGRGYTFSEAARAFQLVRGCFDNAGIDLIVGYPGDDITASGERLNTLKDWGLSHCSVYALQNERRLEGVPEDDMVLDRIRDIAGTLEEMGLHRYEISNYALTGRECRHNLAVWRGEDYLGFGEGAYGRIGLVRTLNGRVKERVSEDFDRKERTLFRLRTCEGLDACAFPQWYDTLDRFVVEGLLTGDRKSGLYQLTARGMEVCDTILAELI